MILVLAFDQDELFSQDVRYRSQEDIRLNRSASRWSVEQFN